MKNLVIFWGWTAEEKTYQLLEDTAPKDWQIYHVSYDKLIPDGQVDGLNEKVLLFLKENQLEEVNILGHSLGGALAIRFTSDHPDKVNHLYLIDSEGIYDRQHPLKTLNIILHSFDPKNTRKTAFQLRGVWRVIKNPIQHIRLAWYAHHIDLQTAAPKIKVPTTILWGEKDGLTPLWQGEKLHKLIKNSKLIILKGFFHDWILYSPELFWKNI
jgi:pimeloyl-ACP methyl ester carboxylesterase